MKTQWLFLNICSEIAASIHMMWQKNHHGCLFSSSLTQGPQIACQAAGGHVAHLVQTLSRGLWGTCCLSVGGEAWNQKAPQQVRVQPVSKCGSIHIWVLCKREKKIFYTERYFRGVISYLNIMVSLLGVLKKPVTLTGSPQPSSGLWYSSLAGKLNLSFCFSSVTSLFLWIVRGHRGLKVYRVTRCQLCAQQYSGAGCALHLQPRGPCGTHPLSCHHVLLMGLSMSVGFNRWDIWGGGSLYPCNTNPSEGTFDDGDSMGKEEPSDREQVSISWYLWADIDRSNEISAACFVGPLAWKHTSVMLLPTDVMPGKWPHFLWHIAPRQELWSVLK